MLGLKGGAVTYQSFLRDRPLPGELRGTVGRQLLAARRRMGLRLK
jgi:hypothetical protein